MVLSQSSPRPRVLVPLTGVLCLVLTVGAARPASAAQADDRARIVGQPVALLVEPAAIVLTGPRSGQQLVVTGRYADGTLRDLTRFCDWRPARAALIDIHTDGLVRPRQNGTTTLTIHAGGQTARAAVVVKDFTRPQPVSFRREVMAALSVGGCSSIGCHGAPSGKNGFRLSLGGYDPAADFLQLTRDQFGRRTNRFDAASSLIMQKALGQIPHEGGRRFAADNTGAQVFRRWLAEGVHDDPPRLPSLKSLAVFPSRRVLHAPARRQQLAVRASFAEGSATDVTRLTTFHSSDEAIARVTTTGLVKFEQSGEVAILCHYLGQVVSVRLMHLAPKTGFQWTGPPENNYVDRHVFAKLKRMSIAPSELCTDQEFIRRAYLDVCGILPSPHETRTFLASTAKDRRARLIDALLKRPEYADYWTMKWADVLRISKKAIQLAGAKAYHGWLRQQVDRDTPLDQVVRTLLTARGASYTTPAANFYCVVPLPPDAKDIYSLQNDLVETTGQLFLGIRLQCAKCHNHPYERWTQDDFSGLAAFFAQVKQTRTGKPPSSASHQDLRSVSISLDAKAPEVVQPLTGKVLPPRLPGGPVLKFAPNQDRRVVLAGWLTRGDNPFFARAIVNRVWFHLLGRGIVDPVDDFRDSNPSANDELLDALARDFVHNKFKVKPLLRAILNSRTYQLSARSNAFNREDTRYFSHLIPRLLPAEVLLDALCSVTGVPESFPDFPAGTRAVQLPFGDVIVESVQYQKYEQHPFLRAFGQPARDLVCTCAREQEFNPTHALELMIGPTLTAKLRRPDNRLGQLLAGQGIQTAPAVIVDDLDAACTRTTGWTKHGVTGGYKGTYHAARAGNGSETATWVVKGLKPGRYGVGATWPAAAWAATDAPYQLFDGRTLRQSVMVNQQAAPAGGPRSGGMVFQRLATVTVTSGTLRVVGCNKIADVKKWVIADAIHVARLPSDAEILNELYVLALSRPPSPAAAKVFLGHVARSADRRKAWEDVLWTMLRSREFVYRH